MRTPRACHCSSLLRWLTAGSGLAAAVYGAYVGTAWFRYGRARPPAADEVDPLLDRFMPEYEVVERHHVRVAAPPEVTLAAASEMNLLESRMVGAIFRGRALILGGRPDDSTRPRGLLALVQSLGWTVLLEVPDHELILGCVTKPWEPSPTFRGLPPEAFAAFAEPGYVKIAWTLRADSDGPGASIFRSETRAIAIGPLGAGTIPAVLVVPVARDHPDPSADARAVEGRSRASRSSHEHSAHLSPVPPAHHHHVAAQRNTEPCRGAPMRKAASRSDRHRRAGPRRSQAWSPRPRE